MDGQAEEGHRAKRSAQFRANGALHEFVLAPDDSCGRLHRSRRKTGGAKTTVSSSLKENTPRPPRTGSDARCVQIPVVATYAHRHCECGGGVEKLYSLR